MDQRYFLDDNVVKTTRMPGRPGDGHIDIAREVLPQRGVAPNNDHDVYVQMFNLKFVRILEKDDGSVDVEHGAALTAAQKRVVKEFKRQQRVINIIRRRGGAFIPLKLMTELSPQPTRPDAADFDPPGDTTGVWDASNTVSR